MGIRTLFARHDKDLLLADSSVEAHKLRKVGFALSIHASFAGWTDEAAAAALAVVVVVGSCGDAGDRTSIWRTPML